MRTKGEYSLEKYAWKSPIYITRKEKSIRERKERKENHSHILTGIYPSVVSNLIFEFKLQIYFKFSTRFMTIFALILN